MKRQLWTEHVFQINNPIGWTENIITRLISSEIHLKHLVKDLNESQLSHKPNKKWSIKEHIGHLIDLEHLHILRITEFAKKVTVLSAADMTNRATEQANYNSQSTEQLIAAFQKLRVILLEEYRKLEKEHLLHQATHPRLKVPMRPVDLLSFTAEHDEHHLTSIRLLKEL